MLTAKKQVKIRVSKGKEGVKECYIIIATDTSNDQIKILSKPTRKKIAGFIVSFWIFSMKVCIEDEKRCMYTSLLKN